MEFGTRAREASQRGRHRRVALAGAHLFADEMWKKKMILPKSPSANSSRAPAARSRRGTRACSSIEELLLHDHLSLQLHSLDRTCEERRRK